MIVCEIDHTSKYLAMVKALGASNSQTLGFFPEGAFDDHARRKQIIVALSDDQELLGYVLYRVSRNRAIIVHLCIDQSNRTQGVATSLFAQLRQGVKDLHGIGLRCKREYEAANRLWRKLGFVALFDEPGRGKDRAMLTFWWFDNGLRNLFSDAIAEKMKTKVCVAMDANVFFDLFDDTRIGHQESRSLQADWLSNAIELCLTDEIFNDIYWSQSDKERHRDRQLARQFEIMPCDSRLPGLAESLKHFFPTQASGQDASDRWHLARAIASDIQYFVTRDQDLLNIAPQLFESFGITILRPTDLIVRLDEVTRESEYAPTRLAGTLSEFRRVHSGEENSLKDAFQVSHLGETQLAFKTLIRNTLADPHGHACFVALDQDKNPMALIAYSRQRPGELGIPVFRVGRNPNAGTLARCLIFHALVIAANEDRLFTIVADPYQSDTVRSALAEDGFVKTTTGSIKISIRAARTGRQLSESLDASRLVSHEITETCEQLVASLRDPMTLMNPAAASEIERLLWPVKVVDANIPNFLVPIRAEWAKELFDEGLASQTLFGAKTELGLSRESVYYRAKQNHGGLIAPGRILWYVTKSSDPRFDGIGCIRACSRLEDVVVGKPKDLFRRFRRLGIYDWDHVFEIAKRKIDNEIMALLFSDTELFKAPIELAVIRKTVEKFGRRPQFQSPFAISPELFTELYRRGTNLSV